MITYHLYQICPRNDRHFSRRRNNPGHLRPPAAMDRRAGFLMGLGRIADAERLSHLAEALRQRGSR